MNDFISAGFMITKKVDRDIGRSPDLLPEKLISISHCISNFIPDAWILDWTGTEKETREKNVHFFGISNTDLPEVITWITSKFRTMDIGWPYICFKLETAKEIKEKFLSNTTDIVILELGLNKKHIKSFCESPEVGTSGIYDAIISNNKMSNGGVILGFELLEYDQGGLACSWLCNGLEKEFNKLHKIRPNKNGFIESFEDACKCTESLSRKEVPAEPGLWLPWLLVEHK